MTDEELEERVRAAYADVKMSPEAEERVLANLLAAEQRFAAEEEDTAAQTVRPKRRADRRRWRWVAPASIAAVLLIGVIVGTQIIPASRSPKDSGTDGGIVLMTSGESEGVAEENAAASERSMEADSAVPSEATAEVVVLDDGSRFAIVDLYVPDEVDPGELDWQPAHLEGTGDACEAALLEDGTCVVLFEEEGDLFLAVPQP
ncbi:MAG: hypothetical protein Q4D39_03400 [Coriobacteriaceae bacterium]|nr:hypothetical protein [Coriobacteriaceae bacterium]